MPNDIDLSNYFYNSEVLAKKVLEIYFSEKIPSYPIDPFDILSYFDILYQFRDFKDLEGIYILPKDEEDIPIIGINNNRPITRQRFTAAHELCHHLKDRNSDFFCPINGIKNDVEKYADKFASELLMPTKELEVQVKKLEQNGYIDFINIIYITDYFGVSFESCVFNMGLFTHIVQKFNRELAREILITNVTQLTSVTFAKILLTLDFTGLMGIVNYKNILELAFNVLLLYNISNRDTLRETISFEDS